jgi:dCMP deaminase
MCSDCDNGDFGGYGDADETGIHYAKIDTGAIKAWDIIAKPGSTSAAMIEVDMWDFNKTRNPHTLKWQVRFMRQAREWASYSKDPSSKVGCVVVSQDRRPLSYGFNGFPDGIADDGRLHDREVKYEHVIHAELNAIMNAAKVGTKVGGETLYLWELPPCHRCAAHILQAGIGHVTMIEPDPKGRYYDEWINKSKPKFDERIKNKPGTFGYSFMRKEDLD